MLMYVEVYYKPQLW